MVNLAARNALAGVDSDVGHVVSRIAPQPKKF
jgi:hypothetical protein